MKNRKLLDVRDIDAALASPVMERIGRHLGLPKYVIMVPPANGGSKSAKKVSASTDNAAPADDRDEEKEDEAMDPVQDQDA